MKNGGGGDLCAGLDIGGTNLRLALLDKNGTIVGSIRSKSRIEEGIDSFCSRLVGLFDDLRKMASDSGSELSAIGIGIPGLIERSGVIRSSVNMRPLEGFNLSAFLENQLGIPVFADNDANLIALGEQIYGAGRGVDSFIVITIGTGLGSGLILDRKIWRGSSGFASEFGHVTLYPDGIPCSCGNRGCLEQYVSAGALTRYYLEIAAKTSEEGGIDGEKISLLARNGDSSAISAFSRLGESLGIALASLTNTLDLEAAIIGGGVGGSLKLMLPALENALKQRSFLLISSKMRVIGGELGDEAGLMGGGALARYRLESGHP